MSEMTGQRRFKSASLRLCVPQCFSPDDMSEEDFDNFQCGIREIIDVQAGSQRKGHATRLMHEVCKEADIDGKVLMLQVLQFDDGMGTEQLQRWYQRFGFNLIQTEPCLLMSRQPR